jgi:hypothetical protein
MIGVNIVKNEVIKKQEEKAIGLFKFYNSLKLSPPLSIGFEKHFIPFLLPLLQSLLSPPLH